MKQVVINPEVVIINLNTGKMMNEDEIKPVIENAFIQLASEFPLVISMQSKNAIMSYSVDCDHICPVFNFIARTALRQSFRRILKNNAIGFMQIEKKHAERIKHFNLQKDNEANEANEDNEDNGIMQLLPFATLALGTVGIRKTNRDISYELRIEDLPTNQILEIIRPYVAITNEDKSNRNRTWGYRLTCRTEIEQFMTACKLENVYIDALVHVETYQQNHDLKRQYDGERIAENAKPMMYQLKLAA